MKTKKQLFLLLMISLTISVWSCKKKSDSTTTTTTTTTTSSSICPTITQISSLPNTNLSGCLNGVLLENTTYYLTGDVTIDPNSSLVVEPGVTVIANGNYIINVRGLISTNGTLSAPIKFTVPTAAKTGSNNGLIAGYGGAWGGLNCDSAVGVSLHFTVVEYMGGPDATGSPRLGISCEYTKSLSIEDCWVRYCYDDGLRIHGTQNCIVRRNTFEHVGSTGGESINIKQGATGDCSYNIIWNSATKAIKLETDATVLYPQTQWNVYNNTVINSGFRNAAKPGPGTSIDLNSQANVFNNLYINALRGVCVFQQADSAHTFYDNNLFISTDGGSTADSTGLKGGEAYYTFPLATYFYDTTDKGCVGYPGLAALHKRFHDKRYTFANAAALNAAGIVTSINDFSADIPRLDWMSGAAPYNVNLPVGSPAIGAGRTTPFTFVLSGLSVAPTPGADIGAKQSASSSAFVYSNQH
ncbi:MAG TPA: right-handed parallel beta-helix repeat-containing protein [Cytophagaceae bacterium]|jgi:hypothetical protein|nr:right-handed parallel beta-helix repeat-containing protein [Cytophagaceae bacterium]